MTAQKLTLCLVIVLVAGIATASVTIQNECSIGHYEPGDRTVSFQEVVVEGTEPQVKTVTKTFNLKQWEKITVIQAIDMIPKSNATCDYAINSGPGYVSVVFTFRKPRGQRMVFIIPIDGV